MHFKKYLYIYFSIVLVYFSFSAALNWFIDPFNELGRNKIGLFFSTDRQRVKNISLGNYDAILIGSSLTLGIPVNQLNYYTFFNASFPNALPEEIYYFLKKHVKNQKVVVLGLDFFVFNERAFPLVVMQEWPDHFYGRFEYLMSFNVLKSSFIAIIKSIRGEKPLTLEEKILVADKRGIFRKKAPPSPSARA